MAPWGVSRPWYQHRWSTGQTVHCAMSYNMLVGIHPWHVVSRLAQEVHKDILWGVRELFLCDGVTSFPTHIWWLTTCRVVAAKGRRQGQAPRMNSEGTIRVITQALLPPGLSPRTHCFWSCHPASLPQTPLLILCCTPPIAYVYPKSWNTTLSLSGASPSITTPTP